MSERTSEFKLLGHPSCTGDGGTAFTGYGQEDQITPDPTTEVIQKALQSSRGSWKGEMQRALGQYQ